MENPIALKFKIKELNKQIENLTKEMSVLDLEDFCSLSISEEDELDEEKVTAFRRNCTSVIEEMSLDQLTKSIDWLIEIDYNKCKTEI